MSVDLTKLPMYAFAKEGHESISQVRKYTNEPYFNHPVRVTQILVDHGITDSDILNAALAHDLVEDVYPKSPKYSLLAILNMFGANVARMVNETTNVYTREAFPQYNRGERNEQEAARLATISIGSRLIKLADIIDNVKDIKINDPGYAVKYVKEKQNVLFKLLKGIGDIDSEHVFSKLYFAAWEVCNLHGI